MKWLLKRIKGLHLLYLQFTDHQFFFSVFDDSVDRGLDVGVESSPWNRKTKEKKNGDEALVSAWSAAARLACTVMSVVDGFQLCCLT